MKEYIKEKDARIVIALGYAWIITAAVGLFIPELKAVIVGLAIIAGSICGVIFVKAVHNRYIKPAM